MRRNRVDKKKEKLTHGLAKKKNEMRNIKNAQKKCPAANFVYFLFVLQYCCIHC